MTVRALRPLRPVPLPGCGCAADYARWLQAGAAGLLGETAAVRLLAEHGTWLSRPAFTSRYITVAAAPGGHGDLLAHVRWRAALAGTRSLPASQTEKGIVAIAASLAIDTPVRLAGCLASLDSANARAVLRAVATAAASADDLVFLDEDFPF